MSLIKCPECGDEVSSKADVCPHCGVAIAGNVKRCPVCQSYVLMAATSCPHCNTKFIVPDEQAQTADSKAGGDESIMLEPSIETKPADAATQQPVVVEGADSQPAPQPKKSGAFWWIVLIALLALAVAGVFFLEHRSHAEAEAKAYALLANCTDPLNYEDFIARFPKSEHIADVRHRLAELNRIDEVWEKTCNSMDVLELQAFIDTHPGSTYKKVALHKIDSLDWRNADRLGTAAAYDTYISRHDNGEYVTQAYTARENARRREEQARRDSIAASLNETDSLGQRVEG